MYVSLDLLLIYQGSLKGKIDTKANALGFIFKSLICIFSIFSDPYIFNAKM
jgi:hypothetical protein